MKTLILTVAFLISFSISAFEVETELSPKSPVRGESFLLQFKIKTDTSGEPDISFNPNGLEVLGKENRGVSIRTLFVNGRISTSREIVYAYELAAARAGSFRLSNVTVEISGQTQRVKDIMVSVLDHPVEKPDYFAQAEVSKKTAYVGEPILVRYYLYLKRPAATLDVKEFPKLNGFIKRFLENRKNGTTRAAVDNEIYEKTPIYSVLLFPEKPGDLRVDPIRAVVQYVEGRANDPFGLSMNRGQLKTKTIPSETVVINVRPLPTENMPPSFTGLVGKHEFDLRVNKTKFLANEPIEFKLVAKGTGALENYNGPKLLSDPAIESFETNADLQIRDEWSAMKTYNYTYLGRGAAKLPATKLPLSYFDLQTGKYVTVQLDVPAIEISGAPYSPPSNAKVDTPSSSSVPTPEADQTPKKKRDGSGLVSPVFSTSAWHMEWIKIANIALALVLLLLLPFLLRRLWKAAPKKSDMEMIISEIRRDGINYSRLYRLLSLLDKDPKRIKTKTLRELLAEANVGQEAQTYFLDLIVKCEAAQFGKQETAIDFAFEKKHFSEISKTQL